MPLLRKLVVLVTLAGVSGTVTADDAALRRCRGISDAAIRLACYDSIALPAPTAAPRTPAQAPAVVPPTATAAAKPMPSPVERFGMEHKILRSDEVERVESHIEGRFEGWRPKSLIRLANGQVWQVVDDSALYKLWDNPKVVVRRGMLGAFYMDFEGDNRSPRVRRVQ